MSILQLKDQVLTCFISTLLPLDTIRAFETVYKRKTSWYYRINRIMFALPNENRMKRIKRFI